MNKLIINWSNALALAVVLSAPVGLVTATAGTTLTDSLVSHLKFDGTYADSTANAIDGTAQGSPTFEAGFLGQAVHITNKRDGSVNNYVSLGYPDLLKFGSSDTGDATDFSFSFWVKIFSQNDDQSFIGNKDWNSGGNKGYVVASEGDGMKWNYRDDDGMARKDSPHVAPQLLDRNWHQVAVTFVRTNNAVIYVDGVPVDTTSCAPDGGNPVGSLDTDGSGFSVNIGQDGTGTYTDGGSAEIDMLMDDVGIWRRALTAIEVLEIYNKGNLGKTLEQDPPLIIPTAIKTQPKAVTVIAGISASFSVEATGQNLAYQWTKNNQPILNATNATYAIKVTTLADAGTNRVVVTGKNGTVTSDPVLLTINPDPVLCNLADGLVAHLKFDNTLLDATANHTDGAAVGEPGFEAGLMGRAVRITTTRDAATNNYVTLGYPEQLKFGGETATNDFTVSFWVKVFEQADDQPFISNKDWASSNNRGWGVFSQSHGNFRVNITSPNGGGDKFNTTPVNVVSDITWHHVTVTVARSGSVNSYVDGNLVDSKFIVTAGTIDTDDLGYAFNLGQDGTGTYTDGGGSEIDMAMDDLGIWKRVLTGDEIACVYVHGLAGKSFDEEFLSAPPTVITTPPANATVVQGLGVKFSVLATGLGLNYQWQFNDSDIQGATASSYSLKSVAGINAGTYRVVVTGQGGSATSSRATLTVLPPPNDCTLTTGLAAHLKFDGSYADASGNGVSGTRMGSPTLESGYIGQAVHISTKRDGSKNNYVTLGYPGALKFGTATDYAVSFWVKVNAQADDQPFISNKDWGSSNNRGWGIFSQGGGAFRVNITGPNGSADKFNTTPASTLNDSAWHLVTVSVARGKTVDSYIDGTLVDSKAIITAGNIDTDDIAKRFNLGQDGTGVYTDGGGSEIDMLMDDVGIWRRTLSSDEVVCIYTHGLAGKSFDESLVAPLAFTAPTLSGGNVALAWTGGTAPFLVQYRETLTSPWIDLVTTGDHSVSLPLAASAGFFRVSDGATKTVRLFRASLNGANERPTSLGVPGNGIGLLSLDGLNVTYQVSYQNLSSAPVAYHLHGLGTAQQAVGVKFGLVPNGTLGTSGSFSGQTTVDQATADGIVAGLTYFNIHTTANGGGEIRGQVLP